MALTIVRAARRDVSAHPQAEGRVQSVGWRLFRLPPSALLSSPGTANDAREEGAAEFAEVVRRRRMVCHFTDEPVAPEVVDRLLALARQAPSAGFTQGQSFIISARQ